jgi:uncharacterized membrane protein required for colicin V production
MLTSFGRAYFIMSIEEHHMLLGNFYIGLIDGALIISILLAAVFGFRKGFIKQVLAFGAFAGAIAISFFTAVYARGLILSYTPVYGLIFSAFQNSVFIGNPLFDLVIDTSNPSVLALLTDGLTQLGLPSFIASPLAGMLVSYNGTLGFAFSSVAADLSLTVIAYVVVFLLAWLILAIIAKQLGKLSDLEGAFKFINGLLGLVLGLVKVAINISFIFAALVPLSLFIPPVNSFLVTDLALNAPYFSIGKYLYQFLFAFIINFIS